MALVAGGARGIGKAIAWRLASEGGQVIVMDMRGEELSICAKEASSQNLQIEVEQGDVTNETVVGQVVEKLIKQHGQLDILVNCVGIVGQTGVKTADYDIEVFKKVLEVNLTAAFILTKYALPPMLSRGYGRILHIASIGGKEGNPGMIAYAASKSGMMGLVKGAGKEYAENGITINGLAPAVIATEFNEKTDPGMIEYMTSKIPMRRMGTVEEVAALSCWIVSEEASFNTGFIFDLSGGRATY